jgi:cytoskeletal protein RodZ
MKQRYDDPPSLGRTLRGCVLFLLPFLALYAIVVGLEKNVGFSAAYAQEATTTRMPTTTRAEETTTRVPTTTRPTTTEPEEPSTTFMPSTTRSTVGPPSTTYMIPGITTVPDGGGVNPPNATREDCHTPPGVTEVTWKCGGATWICHDKVSTPGTYCIDP